jgi:prevent-host-death family protein
MTNERMQASEFRADLREALNRVEYNGVHIEIHRREKVAGVLVPLADYERMMQVPQHEQYEQESSSPPAPQRPQPDRDDWMEWSK